MKELIEAFKVDHPDFLEANPHIQETILSYAKHQSIAFAEWVNDNYAEIGGCGTWCLRGEDGGETYSILGLYDLWIKGE